MVVLAHHECSLGLQRCPSEGELCRVALSSHFALEILTSWQRNEIIGKNEIQGSCPAESMGRNEAQIIRTVKLV